MKWLKEFEKKEEKREQERKEIAERHHTETMDLLKNYILFLFNSIANVHCIVDVIIRELLHSFFHGLHVH